jgi:uncharacterized protein involved in outer membrane biogenesis
MKQMKKFLTATLLAIIAAAVWFVISLDDRIKAHIEKTATTLTGVPVSIESLNLSLWSGKGMITGLAIKNPERYSDNNAFEMGSISVDVDMSSVFSQPLVVSEMLIDGTSIRLEFLENLDSNLQAIVNVSNKQNNVGESSGEKQKNGKKAESGETGETANAQTPETATVESEVDESEDDSEYLIQIKKLRINETTFSATRGDDSWSDTLAELEMSNLGKEKGISTRAIGINIVTKLTRKTLSQAAGRKLSDSIKEQLKEVGSNFLELLQQ